MENTGITLQEFFKTRSNFWPSSMHINIASFMASKMVWNAYLLICLCWRTSARSIASDSCKKYRSWRHTSGQLYEPESRLDHINSLDWFGTSIMDGRCPSDQHGTQIHYYFASMKRISCPSGSESDFTCLEKIIINASKQLSRDLQGQSLASNSCIIHTRLCRRLRNPCGQHCLYNLCLVKWSWVCVALVSLE
jgi:hypothetical protein